MSENGAAMCCQQTAFAPQSISLELGDGHQTVDGGSECYDDDDGRTKRTGKHRGNSRGSFFVLVLGSKFDLYLAIKRSNCFREKGQKPCHASKHSLHDHLRRRRDLPLPDLVALAAVVSFTYSSIGQGIAQVVGPPPNSQSFLALEQRTEASKVASPGSASASSRILADPEGLVQPPGLRRHRRRLLLLSRPHRNPGHLKAPSPSEARVMEKASLVSIITTMLFYMLCGCMGYAAFGDEVPSNLLTNFGFYPLRLLNVANGAIVVHLVGACQIFCQPLFAFVEKWASTTWPDCGFVTREISLPLTLASILQRRGGAARAPGFWPLTVYFPVEMYVAQNRIRRWSTRWVCLQMLSLTSLMITVAAIIVSVAGIVTDLQVYRPFKSSYRLIN
ncbi:hypothetical protein ZIOFF_063435 [Zingiber officinale]|uniref:Amino acid transporter transmembrane domain-containing protein n=1 Tax=Zingiber officinale TaxID=94328 RepID=A0A8J5F254_ZINOF|nr:hypothetical protein ZIOFF_063435 [Zingiber officinale]